MTVTLVETVAASSTTVTSISWTTTSAQAGDLLLVVHQHRGSDRCRVDNPYASDMFFQAVLAGCGAYRYDYVRASYAVQPDSTQRTITANIGGTQTGWGHSGLLLVLRGVNVSGVIKEADRGLTYLGSSTNPSVATGPTIAHAGSMGFALVFTNDNNTFTTSDWDGYQNVNAGGNSCVAVAWKSATTAGTLPDVTFTPTVDVGSDIGCTGWFGIRAG